MKVFKEKNFLLIVIIFVLVTISSVACIKIFYNICKNQTNYTIAKLASIIQEKYPDTSEEEIIRELNSHNNISLDNTFLKKYGISNEVSAINMLKYEEKNVLIINEICLFAIFIFATIIYIVLYYKRKKNIDEIISYINKINSKTYDLEIEKNTEDEFSNLRNELYKIVIVLKEQAEKSQEDRKAIGVAMEDISHQLKTPLTSISIMLDNIIENENMDEITRKKFLHEIRRQLEWINWLVISLLKLSKLDSNTVEFNCKEFLVSDLIENLVQNLSVPLEIKQQEIIIDGDSKAKVYADYNWQLEAISNILKNCIEHTDEGKRIYISYSENNFYTSLCIKDEGSGISREDLKHIFERFYKGKSSNENSIGIGLALSKKIIEKDNGYIVCTSKLGKGTTFEIRYMKVETV